jgi:hypothetical protein
VFITENEINGLAFPAVAHALVIFGLGYGVDLLSGVEWLKDLEIHYRLRSMFPSAQSLLMDRETLLAHRPLWVQEPAPHTGQLTRLTEAEQVLFEDLQYDRLGEQVRLEQERVSFNFLTQTLERICGSWTPAMPKHSRR